jgi:hypothetical protein
VLPAALLLSTWHGGRTELVLPWYALDGLHGPQNTLVVDQIPYDYPKAELENIMPSPVEVKNSEV